MKTILKGILINSLAIALVSMVLPSIHYDNTLSTLVVTAIVLGIANTFLKPILSLILLPINIITLGIIGLFLNALLLLIVTLLVPSFSVVPFTVTMGASIITISIFWSYVITSTALNLVAGILRSILNT